MVSLPVAAVLLGLLTRFLPVAEAAEARGVKELSFSQPQIDEEFKIHFNFIQWAAMSDGSDPTHGFCHWNLSCWATSDATYIGTAEWTIHDSVDEPITGTKTSPGRVWCDNGDCGGKVCPNIDTDTP
ncbi:uncharacterized protein IL334_005701 [Kwoniella shivajii]|uniref:Uncharacterized protein n=1 Tax=Kwoniella shivajii TaxID=564305 RepID=A0ABZ1D6Y9_9TREE|nr:hypothetical protein IL334_005701 [Kwoniella shivajii]